MKLFEEFHIGKLTLKNRVVLAPMGTTTDQSCAFNQKDVEYYGERAKGGAGLVLTGAVSVSYTHLRYQRRLSGSARSAGFGGAFSAG